jgi:hypothetical protein
MRKPLTLYGIMLSYRASSEAFAHRAGIDRPAIGLFDAF